MIYICETVDLLALHCSFDVKVVKKLRGRDNVSPCQVFDRLVPDVVSEVKSLMLFSFKFFRNVSQCYCRLNATGFIVKSLELLIALFCFEFVLTLNCPLERLFDIEAQRCLPIRPSLC